jgi:hypothetical protein
MNTRFIYSHQAERFLVKNRSSLTYERVETGLKLAASKILLTEQNIADIT